MLSLKRQFRALIGDQRGSVAITFGIAGVVIVGLAIGAVNFASALTQKNRVQDVVDSAALAADRLYVGSTTDSAVIAAAQSVLSTAVARYPDIMTATVAPNSTTKSVTVTYRQNASQALPNPLTTSIIPVGATATATLGGTAPYPVCILITDDGDNHTLRTSNESHATLNHCVVQVNTQNWDAVEAANTSYIHINDGQNCFVGQIHFGDVLPKKVDSCQLMADPFSSITVPTYSTCNFTNFDNKVSGATLSPGTYCGGLTIEKSATLNPGVYVVKNGDLNIKGSTTSVTATGVTFVLTGNNAGLTFDGGSNPTGVLNFSPATNAGAFSGFVFFLDQNASYNPLGSSIIKGYNVNLNGTIYLKGQKLVIDNDAEVVVNPGSIVTDFLLPQNGNITLTGTRTPTTTAELGLQKNIPSNMPVLVR
jgi:Flp pilus assembly protein TadG